MTTNRFAIRICSLAMIGLLLVCQMWAQAGPVLPNPGNSPVSREQQIQLGFQAAAEVYKQMPVLPDNSPETQYVRQIGQRLVATIPQPYSWPFEFHTIAAKDVNAFALPGGPMFVNVGTILAATNEAELAGVMAHEMAHVYMQHSAKQMEKTSLMQGLAGLAGAILGGRGVWGNLAALGIQFGAGTLMLKYSRQDEAQADAVGAMIMYKAGYDPRALAAFFETITAEGGSQGPQFLSDHPNPGNREEAILNEAQNWPPEQYRTDKTAFNRIRNDAKSVTLYTAQQIADGAKSGKWAKLNRENGAVFKAPPGVQIQPTSSETNGGQPPPASGPVSWNQVAPSSRMVTANLGSISIARPENWDLIAPQQQGQSYSIAPRAAFTGNGLGYGVVVNQVTPQYGNSNLDQVTSQIVQQMQRGGGDLQPVGSQQSITVNGVRGRSQMMESTSPFPASNGQSQKETDWLVTVPQQDGSVVYLVFVSTQADFDRLKPVFNRMLRSLRF